MLNTYYRPADEIMSSSGKRVGSKYIVLHWITGKGIGKTQEDIAKDIQRSRYFFPQEAIDYGLADKILPKQGLVMEKRVSINHF